MSCERLCVPPSPPQTFKTLAYEDTCMTYEDVVNLALRRGLFYPASEIYQNAPAGFYDFGPYGATIRRNIIEHWRKTFVQHQGFLEIDGAITMPEDVFNASGHLDSFNDPMTQCAKCNTIHRADKLIEEQGHDVKEATPVDELTAALRKDAIHCPKCGGELLAVKQFNLMVKAEIGASQTVSCYLRPESCQSIFTSWHRIMNTMRVKLPQGISQVGRVYRNEISPRQTLIRQVEFMQMESEIFFDPKQIDEVEGWDEIASFEVCVLRQGNKDVEHISAEQLVRENIVSGKLVAHALARTQQLYERYGIPRDTLRFREVGDDERAFYAKEGWDLEVHTSLGWIELGPINYRTDYDLKRHMEESGQDLHYAYDDGTKIIPHVLEISLGVDRTFYAVLELAYRTDEKRMWLSLPEHLAPLQLGIFPLLKNKPPLVSKAKEIYHELQSCYKCFYDESGSIGKRYARLDEIGIPFCITIDFETIEDDNAVTLRDRDSAEQKRIKISDLRDVLYKLFTGTAFADL